MNTLYFLKSQGRGNFYWETIFMETFPINAKMINYLQTSWCFRNLLDNEVYGGVVAAESVGGHAGEHGRVRPLCPSDAARTDNIT